MPRTKLDRFCVSKPDADAKIIRIAMARNGIYTDRELARKIGTNYTYVSKCFKSGFSMDKKLAMHKVMNFTQEEREVLGGW